MILKTNLLIRDWFFKRVHKKVPDIQGVLEKRGNILADDS